MDPNTTLAIETIGDRYFKSLNEGNRKLHLVDVEETPTANIASGTIEKDVGVWYAGFRACLQMVPQIVGDSRLSVLSSQLPPVENITTYVTKNFASKAKMVTAA